jgi:mRNA-degrading endonuclease RelE of RelBE toxin-antitoxin system
MWRVYVPKKLLRKLARHVPERDEARIWAALHELERHGPYAGGVLSLLGNEHRMRVGDYRIIFEADLGSRVIRVKQVTRRTTTTYRKR